MKLPLIGLQTNPSGTASSPSSTAPPPLCHDPVLPAGGPHLLTTWFSKGLITSVSPACDTITTCSQPSGLSPELSAWPQHGVLTHSHGTLPQSKCAPCSLSLTCMAVG